MNKITMREMLEAGVHFGHQTRYWNPKMAPYIFGVRHKIHIINLEQSLPMFEDAINFISSVAAKNGKILFVGTKKSARDIMREEAIRCGMPYIDYRWLGGMLTNYKTIRQSIKRLKDLEAMRDSKRFAVFTKKETQNLVRELTKLERALGGIKNMGGLPDVVFVVDVGNENIAVKEARKLSIPVVGIVDTNYDPDGIDYIVPGNDDAIRSIRFYTKHIADAIIEARATLIAAQKIEEGKEDKGEKKEDKNKKKVAAKKVTVIKKVENEAEETTEVVSEPEESKEEAVAEAIITEDETADLIEKVAPKKKTVVKKTRIKTASVKEEKVGEEE
jgi:small subunit ribosomal protein S2